MDFKIKYENKYIAFLDVLGFSALVESDNKEKLETYFNAISGAFDFFDEKIKQIKKLIISDSIILIAPDTNDSFKHMLDAIRVLQVMLATQGIWIRGGISFGEVFYDDEKNAIIGKGYIKAYLLEQEAIYPRIIIDPSILAKMNVNRQEFYDKYNRDTLNRPLDIKAIHEYNFQSQKRYTSDDAIFICYASALIISSIQENNLAINNIFLNIKKNLYGEQKHYHKYLWLKKYFLECMEELNSNIEDKSSSKVLIIKLINDFKAL